MKKLGFVMMIFCSIIIVANDTYAVGIGIYATGGTAMSNWMVENENFGSSTDYCFGGGLLIDTAVAKNKLFNYRMAIGYEWYGSNNPSLYNVKPDYNFAHKFDMSHTFGLGIYRTKTLRFWVGPEVGLTCLYSPNFRHVRYMLFPPNSIGESGLISGGFYALNVLYSSPTKKLLTAGIDILMTLGVNYNIGDRTSLFTDIGFGYTGTFHLEGDREIGSGLGIKARIGVLSRMHDAYEAEPVAM